MDDITATISQILNDPNSVRQIQNMAASLGLTGAPPAGGSPAAPAYAPQPQQAQSGGIDTAALSGLLSSLGASTPPAPAAKSPDLSALAGMLSGLVSQSGTGAAPAQNQTGGADLSALAGLLGGGASAAPQPAAANGTPDLSALAGMLSGLVGQNSQGTAPAQNQAGGADLSALSGLLGSLGAGQAGGQGPAMGLDAGGLAALLSAGNPDESAHSTSPGFDLSAMLKLQQAMASMQSNRSNIDLLLSLKPRLSDKRSKKIDDAIKVMQLIQFFPLLKETGLFSGLDQMLGGLNLGGILGGGSSGGLGGLGNLLGGLLGGRS